LEGGGGGGGGGGHTSARSCHDATASRRRAPSRLRQPEPRMRLAVRGVPKGALRTYSTWQAPLWGSLVTCVMYCLRVRQYGVCVSLFM